MFVRLCKYRFVLFVHRNEPFGGRERFGTVFGNIFGLFIELNNSFDSLVRIVQCVVQCDDQPNTVHQ